MQFDYSLIDEQLVITDPKDFHYNCDDSASSSGCSS